MLPPVRVLLVDERPLVRSGLRALLDAEADLEVVGDEADPAGAVRVLLRVPADVVVLHGEPARGRLLGDVRALAGSRPAPAVLLLTGPTDVETTLRALLAGASGHVWLSAAADHVVHVVRTVADGAVVVPGRTRTELDRYLVRRLDGQDATRLGSLSERELRVLTLLADGRSNVEIAQDLVVSPATVKKYLSQVLRKLGLRDRLQAGLYGYRLGLGRTAQTDRPGPAE